MADQSPYLRFIQKTATTTHPRGLNATKALLQRSPLRKNSKVLDVGCGAGITSAFVAKTYECEVYAIDSSSEVIEKAQSLYKKNSCYSKLHFMVGDVSHLPFNDNFFDMILCESVLIFVSDKETAINEMFRVLKPFGYMGLNEIVANDSDYSLMQYFSRKEFLGYLINKNEFVELFNGHSVLLSDEEPINIFEQLKSEIPGVFSPHGIFRLLEFGYDTFTNKQVRNDMLELIRFFMEMPEGGIRKLISMLFLVQKKG